MNLKMKHDLSQILKPWTTKEKLSLSSAVLRSGDENWLSVSQILKVSGEKDRPPEWYSQKQCALHYNELLNNIFLLKRKKRSEKGEAGDTSNESIVSKLLQDRLEELNSLLDECKREYSRIKKEKEDIEAGKLDDQLDEFEKEIEEEKERENLKSAKFNQIEEMTRKACEPTFGNNHEAQETKLGVSPLLTSLLQSPNSYRGLASNQSLLSPTRVKDSPTLSKLLESPTKQLEPTALRSNYLKKEPESEESITNSTAEKTQPPSASVFVEEIQTSEIVIENIKEEEQDDKDLQTEEEPLQISQEEAQGVQIEEVVVELSTEADVDKIVPPLNSQHETEESYGEKEEQEQSSSTTLQESDSMEEQHSITELDSQMVNMIVAGEGVISVSHGISSEHLDLSNSGTQLKEDVETAVNLHNIKSELMEVEVAVHEVEVTLTSDKCDTKEEEDVIQDLDTKDHLESPDIEPQEESQEEKDVNTSDNEKNDKEEKEEDQSLTTQMISRNIVESPVTAEVDSDTLKRPTKKRLISGSVCSDSKPSSPASHTEDSKEYRSWRKAILVGWQRMAYHKYAALFLKPITNEQAPAYTSVIRRPIDMTTIKKRVETGELRTTAEFQRDLLLMFQNAIMYNYSRTQVFEDANIMLKDCLQQIELIVDAMGEGVPWRYDVQPEDKQHVRGRGEAPKRKRVSLDNNKPQLLPKKRKESSL